MRFGWQTTKDLHKIDRMVSDNRAQQITSETVAVRWSCAVAVRLKRRQVDGEHRLGELEVESLLRVCVSVSVGVGVGLGDGGGGGAGCSSYSLLLVVLLVLDTARLELNIGHEFDGTRDLRFWRRREREPVCEWEARHASAARDRRVLPLGRDAHGYYLTNMTHDRTFSSVWPFYTVQYLDCESDFFANSEHVTFELDRTCLKLPAPRNEKSL